MIFKLAGKVQHYDWGGSSFIPSWLKLDQVEAKPYAEYWLGAHRSAPSMIEFEGQWLALDRVLDKAPKLLGDYSREQFGDELPYLLKILDVKLPLSIQLHPTKKEAEYGFEQENAREIPLSAPNRIYKDRNHKPEMMIALSEFWLLHGFQSIGKSVEKMSKHKSLQTLVEMLKEKGLPSTYAHIMKAGQDQLAEWILPIVEEKQDEYQQGKLKWDNPDYWLLYTMEAMQISPEKLDAGLLSFYLFNIVHLEKGEGIYQGAGLPHAYLRGQNVELMAASDNVIRGGLTPKYVDIPELLKTINYTEVTPKIIPIYQGDESLHLYDTPEAKDFALQHFQFKPFEEATFDVKNAAILVVLSGSLHIDLQEDAIHLQQGGSIFISAGSTIEIIAETDGYAMIASVP